jgi:murein DD-endopeptidase MepM/ murein hydrolase activator NlpD
MNYLKTLPYVLFLLLWPANLQAELQLCGQLTQGGLVSGQVAAGTRVYYDDRPLKLSPTGRFILGFGRDASARQRLTLIEPDGQVVTKDLPILQRSYKIQRIDGISQALLDPGPEELQRIADEAAQARQARQVDSDLNHFTESFIWPVSGRISGVYGSQRIFNGEPRRPHFGVDIAVPSGTPIIAPAGGMVTLAHQGMFFSGLTLIIDHGHGLSSSFLHLQKILVKKGQAVRQGQRIATVGASGRVTGPHLDWRINWFEQRLDPALLVPAMVEK